MILFTISAILAILLFIGWATSDGTAEGDLLGGLFWIAFLVLAASGFNEALSIRRSDGVFYEEPMTIVKTNNLTVVTYQNPNIPSEYKIFTSDKADIFNSTNIKVRVFTGKNGFGKVAPKKYDIIAKDK